MAIEVIRSKERGQRRVHEFALEFYRDDVPEDHEFKAYPVLDVGSLSYTLSATRAPERAIEGMVRSIKKMLADDDGTPLRYRPTRYVAPIMDVEPESGEPEPDEPVHTRGPLIGTVIEPEPDEELDDESQYVGPDGEPIDAAGVQEALRFKNGSSRRRFTYLMDDDEDLTLRADQLQKVYQRLVGKAADRPTRR